MISADTELNFILREAHLSDVHFATAASLQHGSLNTIPEATNRGDRGANVTVADRYLHGLF